MGAVGIMQIKPSTAADRNVGVPNVHDLESNIHAGVKYLAFLRDRYFDDPAISKADRFFFSLAAYNMGPARVISLRKRAAEEGLDPNRWFDHVEAIARREVGREPVRYVSNIAKYYAAYELMFRTLEERKTQRRVYQTSERAPSGDEPK
jgi:membrane-bound lytic murein transglycosylase MltF